MNEPVDVVLVDGNGRKVREGKYPLDKKGRINIKKIAYEWALKKPIIWEELEEEIREMPDGWSDITFDFVPIIKIQAKQTGKVSSSKTNATSTLMSTKKEDKPTTEKKTYTTVKPSVESKETVKEPVGGWSIDDFEKLSEHVKAGRLTQKEFEIIKKRALGI
eukprot:gene2884-4727_t